MKNILKTAGRIASVFVLTFFISCGKDGEGTNTPSIVETTIDFSEADFTVAESDGQQTVTVNLGSELPEDVSFTIEVSGTATYGEDYTIEDQNASSGSFEVNMEAGQTAITFTLDLINDQEVEEDETLVLTLASDVDFLQVGSKASITLKITSEDYEEYLVAIDWYKSSNTLVEIDPANGSVLSNLVEVTNNGNDLAIQAFTFDSKSELGYVASTSDEFYSIDLKTGEATLLQTSLNGDNFEVIAISSLLVVGNELLYISRLRDTDTRSDMYSLSRLNLLSNEITHHFIDGTSVYFGVTKTDSDNEFYLGREGKIAFATVANSGDVSITNEIQLQADDSTPFTTFEGVSLSDISLRHIAVNQHGEAFAQLFSFVIASNYNEYFASIDPSTGMIEHIATIPGGFISGHTFIPASAFE